MILSNQVRCAKCGDTPFSGSVHDFRSCACGAVSVDGGMHYLRRVGDFANTIDMSIVLPDLACKEAVAAANLVIGDGDDYSLEGLADSIMPVLAKHNIEILNLTENEVAFAVADACRWTQQNHRNGLGALCAIARYVRDAGGEWEYEEELDG